MAKYLNLSGLQTLWTKLKDTFALKKHSHTVEDIPVDSALSSTSTNPVQNKVVKNALDGKANTSGMYKGLSAGSASSSFAGDSNLSDLMQRYDNRGWTLDTPSGEVRQIKKTLARDEHVSIDYQSWKPCRIRIRYSIKTNLQRDDGEGKESWMGTDMAIYYRHNSVAETTITYAGKRVYGAENPEWVDVDVTLNIDNKSYDTFFFFFQTQDSSGITGTKRKGFVWIKGLRIERLPDMAVSAINDKNGKDITSRYVPITRAGIYGCRVKRSKNGVNWYDNIGFQIAESYASSFRTHWVTFRWDSAAQMNGTTGRGCRRFLFGYEETGPFLRCFVSEDDTYWYVWILFMNAKTGDDLRSNTCSVMEMQSVPNGLEVLTTAPDLTNLTEIPWAADERYLNQNGTAKKALALCRNNTVRQSSIDLSHESGGVGNALARVDLLTSAVTTRPGDGFVATFNWDTTAPYDTQLFIPNASTSNNGIPKIRFRDNKSAWGDWGELNIGGNAATASIAATINIGSKNGSWRDILASADEATSVYRAYLRTCADSNNGTILEIGGGRTDNTKGSQIRLVRYDASGKQLTGIVCNSTITENRNWVFPNASGTLALTSDLSSYATKVELNAKQDDISDMIPTAASASNPLCDKAYADAIGERLEARYLGCNANGDPFATHAALTSATKFYYQGAETTPDTNDITTVVADEDHKNTSNVAGTTRYRYGGVDASGKPVWAFEYVINNTGLSQAQLLAVNSGITATKVGNYDSHLADTTKHITAAERTAWNGKQNALTQGTNITISGNTISATDTTYSEPTDTVLQDIVNALT